MLTFICSIIFGVWVEISNQKDEGIIGLYIFITFFVVLFLLYKLKVKRPKFIEKRIKTNQDLYDVCLKDLKEEFPDVISDFGGMESFEKYFK